MKICLSTKTDFADAWVLATGAVWKQPLVGESRLSLALGGPRSFNNPTLVRETTKDFAHLENENLSRVRW